MGRNGQGEHTCSKRLSESAVLVISNLSSRPYAYGFFDTRSNLLSLFVANPAQFVIIKSRMNVAIRKTLDHLAISMAVICGIHCLVTPVVLVALPIVATTFWVDENFHLWMLLLVIPTTTLAVWSGCRRHKDRWVIILAALGLSTLLSSLVVEGLEHGSKGEALAFHGSESQAGLGMPAETRGSSDSTGHAAGGGCCALHPAQSESSERGHGPSWLTWHTLLNTLGGCFLVAGHTRNFVLCRKADCMHGEKCRTK